MDPKFFPCVASFELTALSDSLLLEASEHSTQLNETRTLRLRHRPTAGRPRSLQTANPLAAKPGFYVSYCWALPQLFGA